METIKSIMLFLYMLSIFIGIAGFAITIVADRRKKDILNRSIKIFVAGLVVTNIYDFILFYSNYVLFNMPRAFSIRLGCCIISLLACLWINLQIPDSTGFLSPISVDNRVENVDFPSIGRLHIQSGYTFFRRIFAAGSQK